MYMQNDRTIPPKNYSGNAFLPNGERCFPPNPPRFDPSPDPTTEPLPKQEEAPMPSKAEAEKDLMPEPTEARPTSGPISRFPLLSSFLPPRREGQEKRASLPDWVLLGAVALLFLADGDNDILPFLLLLLLWE